MRIAGLVGSLGLFLTLVGPGPGASADDLDRVEERPRLTVFGDPASLPQPPVILRGSAIPRKAPDPEPARAPGRWEALAGKRLWLADPDTLEIVACDLYQTTQVGERVVRCFDGDLPRNLGHY